MGLKIDNVMLFFVLTLSLLLTGCETYFEKRLVTSSLPEKTTPAADTEKPSRTAEIESLTAPTSTLVSAKPPMNSMPAGPYGKPGFKAELTEDGRLWVYLKGDKNDKPEKHISAIGAGPFGKTIKVKDRSTLNAYLRALS